VRVVAHATRRAIEGPGWSADRRRLAFTVSGTHGILTIPVNGGRVRPITHGDDFDPAWSPTGRWIAFVRRDATGAVSIFVVQPNGRSLHQVGSTANDFADLQWAPDGASIAATVLKAAQAVPGGGGCRGVIVDSLAGTGNVVSGSSCSFEPSWSPGGHSIAFSQQDSSGATRIATVKRDGSGLTTITAGPDDRSPLWAPNGSRIVFSRRMINGRALATISPASMLLRTLTRSQGAADRPAGWSPDGAWVLFERYDPTEDFGLSDLYLVNQDTRTLHRIARNTDLGSATWGRR
jgi:TolB protein